MASVPTGIPPGICAIERSESKPSKADDCIGTTSTGNQVKAAMSPARWAAAAAANAIDLIGFMGAGKSAVGRKLSQRTGWPRYDTDERIREQFGISIPDIFARHGEPAFRDAETALLKTLQRGLAGIVVTGGGIIFCGENVRVFCGVGRIIWLDADGENLWQSALRRSTPPPLQSTDPRA